MKNKLVKLIKTEYDDIYVGRLKGETWKWNKRNKLMTYTNKEQGVVDIHMKWAISHLVTYAIHTLIDLEKEDVHTRAHIKNSIINCIGLLKGVGFYPEEYLHMNCKESKDVFERELTCYELYKIIFHLYLLEKRYNKLMWNEDFDTKAKKEHRDHLVSLYNNPNVFRYH